MEVQHLGATEFKSTRFFVPVTRLKLCPSEYSHRISWFLPSRRPDQNAEVQPDVNPAELTRTLKWMDGWMDTLLIPRQI